jgi:hypothetical protein
MLEEVYSEPQPEVVYQQTAERRGVPFTASDSDVCAVAIPAGEACPPQLTFVERAALDAETEQFCARMFQRGRVNGDTSFFALTNDLDAQLHALKLVENPLPEVARRPRDVFALTLFAPLGPKAFVMGPVLRRANEQRSLAALRTNMMRTYLAREIQRWDREATLIAVPSPRSAPDDTKLLLGSGFGWLETTEDPDMVETIDRVCDLFGDLAVCTVDGFRLLMRRPKRSIIAAAEFKRAAPKNLIDKTVNAISELNIKGGAGGAMGGWGEFGVVFK